MIGVMEEKNIYLSDFERWEMRLTGLGSPAIHRLRKSAIARFAELGFPTPRDEEWRFTNVRPIGKIPFRAVAHYDEGSVSPVQVERASFPMGPCSRLVFVNGHYAAELSSICSLPSGVMIANLASVLAAHPERVELHLGKYANFRNHAFTALNTAFIADGGFLFIPDGKTIDEPIHLLFLFTATEEGAVAHPRNLIVAGANSQATIVETYVSLDESVYFTNAVTELVAGPGSVIDHYKLLRESNEAFHVGTLQVQLSRGCTFSSHVVTLAGAIVRNETNAVLADEHCDCTLNGLYLATGQQLIDNHTVIDHARPHCASHELYKGILDGKARGVFNGKIYVRPNAQKTDAKQTNKTLLLSDDAVINTKPQLEIYADDVKCTHGATVGQLDENSLFYLRSRGLGLEQARALLIFAFANDIIGRIRIEPVRNHLEKFLLATQHLPKDQKVKDVP